MKVFKFVVGFILTIALGGGALAGCVALLVPAGAEFAESTDYGPLEEEVSTSAVRSQVLNRDGDLMTTLFAEEDRQPITLDGVPRHLVDAVLAIEDRNFYEHNGIDWSGVGRALTENLSAGGVEQGGSTITQQLVKNTMSDPERRDPTKRDLKTKFREAIVAYRLEKEITKDEILERYLNVIYLGNGAYGVKAASERYFNKHDPMELTLGESALLAGLIQAPEALNPVTHPDRAARRRSTVLDAMVDIGAIGEEEARAAREEPLPTRAVSPDRRRDYYLDEVVRRLLNEDPEIDGDVAEYLGANQSARYNAVFRGGLVIETTFDPVLQFAAQAAVNETVPESPFTAALVVIDNADGSVRAMVAGENFEQSQYNLATQAVRQTGSSFKAITLAAVLDLGYSPEDRVSGGSLHWQLPGEDWDLSCGGGTMTLATAIEDSNNCAFGRTLISLGPGQSGSDGARAVKNMASRLGIDTRDFQDVVSMTLGTQLTSPLDMAEAFSVFANNGMHRYPMFVSRILDAEGEVIFEDAREVERVLDENVARTETQMLTRVIESGTGRAARLPRPAAGKTGTTNDNADAWFVGYTPQYTAAVWMGHPDGRVAMNNVGGRRVQGGTYPAEIWAAFMKPVHEPLPVIDFFPPNEELWPTAQRVSEDGRTSGREFAPRSTATTTPGDTTPTTTPTNTVPSTLPPVPDEVVPAPPAGEPVPVPPPPVPTP
ncbi:MAG: transglycosylase domain-containing protein [Actinomycetota bacterium]